MSTQPPAKAPKTEEESCLKQDSIPIAGVSRVLSFKVADEKQAVEAEAVLKKIHAVFKADVSGFDKAHRLVCKEHWDVKYIVRFKDLDSIVQYMQGPVKTDKVEPLIKDLEKLVGGDSHSQNFVADDWN